LVVVWCDRGVGFGLQPARSSGVVLLGDVNGGRLGLAVSAGPGLAWDGSDWAGWMDSADIKQAGMGRGVLGTLSADGTGTDCPLKFNWEIYVGNPSRFRPGMGTE